MCSSHAPENGADSGPWLDDEGTVLRDLEPIHWQDRTCDYCAGTQWSGPLHAQKLGRSIALVCDKCFERDQQRYAEAVGE